MHVACVAGAKRGGRGGEKGKKGKREGNLRTPESAEMNKRGFL